MEQGLKRVRLLQQRCKIDQDVDRHQVLRLDADDEQQQKLLVAHQDCDRDQQPVDRGVRTHADEQDGIEPEEPRKGDQRGNQRSAHRRGQVKLHQPARPAQIFEHRAYEPQRQHGKQRAEDVDRHEGVGKQLPDLPMNHINRCQHQVCVQQFVEAPRQYQAKDRVCEEDAQRDQDQAACRTRKGRQGKRGGAGTGHRVSIIVVDER